MGMNQSYPDWLENRIAPRRDNPQKDDDKIDPQRDGAPRQGMSVTQDERPGGANTERSEWLCWSGLKGI
jgi:hypothetical protein